MSKSKPIADGGPAFPLPDNVGTLYHGMSLRDYFAGQALVTLATLTPHIKDRVELTSTAYRIADAMLVAREKSHAGHS